MTRVLRTIVMLALTSALAGCTNFEWPARAAEAHANAWTHDGLLRMVGATKPDNLNPWLGTQVIDTDLAMFWGAYLFSLNGTSDMRPELAAKTPTVENGGVSADGRRITYHLRRGVHWQDGVPAWEHRHR